MPLSAEVERTHRTRDLVEQLINDPRKLGPDYFVQLNTRKSRVVDAMTALHEHFMNEPGPTDVLAFPMDELDDRRDDTDDTDAPPTLLGDVVLCPVVAEQQANEAGHSTEAELHLLCTHGVLHLLGYDHAEPDEHKEMFDLQATLLAQWRAQGQGEGKIQQAERRARQA